MYIVHVHVLVKVKKVDAFITATIENANRSRRTESGVVRFDLIQEIDNPTRFVLVEVYRSKDDADKHKETVHYNQWKKIAEQMMADPRTRTIYENISPNDSNYS
jgi:(4S)-4-hydroxy-5-phosphonooxypentane-2,3-dione isomerase